MSIAGAIDGTTLSTSAACAAAVVFATAMVYAGVTDLRTRKIRNGVPLVLLVAYGILAPLAGFGLTDIVFSVAVGLGVLSATFILFALGWIGAGDAKLATATALWLGAGQTGLYLLYTAVLGGAFALLIVLLRNLPLPESAEKTRWIALLRSPRVGMPYGVAMAIAALATFPATQWMAIS